MISLMSIFIIVFSHGNICISHEIYSSSYSENDSMDNYYVDLNHDIHKVVKRASAWSFHGSQPGPEFILPKCPCQSLQCQDYEYCYCKLGYDPPLSEVTGEPFLVKSDGCDNSDGNQSILFKFNESPLLEKYLAAFPLVDWDCNERTMIYNQQKIFFPYLCVWKKMLPAKGTFYDTQRPFLLRTTRAEAYQYLLNIKRKQFFWPIGKQKWYSHSTLLPAENITKVAEKKIGFLNFSKPTKQENDAPYVISGGPGCFTSVNLIRRGVSAFYECDIYFDPMDSNFTKEIGCDLVSSILDKEAHYFLNLQVKDIFQLDPNGTIVFPTTTKKRSIHSKYKVSIMKKTLETAEVFEYPSKVCHNVTVGIKIKSHYYGQYLLATEITMLKGKVRKDKLISTTQVIFQSSDADPRYFTNLSRFWYEFYYGKCKEQFCWRDFFTFPLTRYDDSIEGDMEAFFAVVVAIPTLGLVLATFLFHRNFLDLFC